jgi:hypothetical protein
MSSSNTITMVAPAPPRTVVLPNEVLRMIFEYMLVFSSVSPRGRPINDTRFLMLHKCILGKFTVVSRQFHEVALAIFYENNFFEFAASTRRVTPFGVVKAPLLPSLRLHCCLRHIRVVLHLSDSWEQSVVLPDRVLSSWTPFVHTVDLFRYCPAARVLQLLSTTMPRLRTLDLHIVADFRIPDYDAALAIYRSAGFSLSARDEVKVTIVNGFGRPELWHGLLKIAIA